jgi:hypothetical protein
MAKVYFKRGTLAQYNAIASKDSNTLYWVTDEKELYMGTVLYGKGSNATKLVAGLMSAEDKAKLDSLSMDGDGISFELQLSKDEGNAMEQREDGLYVPAARGEKGDTPVKGTDYWTDEDKEEIVAAVLAALPSAEEETF